MTHLDDVVKKMTNTIQAKCAERLEEAAQKVKNGRPTLKEITKEYGISSIMKKKRGL